MNEASRRAETVVPVFILEDAFRTGPDVGAARLAFLLRSLASLRESLLALGYSLVVRRGRSEVELPKLCAEAGAQAVFCNRRYEPYAQARDQRVFNALNAARIGFETFKDAVVWEERELLTKSNQPYTVYTPYSKAWRARKGPEPHGKLRRAKRSAPVIATEAIPTDPGELGRPLRQQIPEAGEAAAWKCLRRFIRKHLFNYAQARDLPAAAATSQLSPHLRCGTIGIRTVLAEIARACDKAGATPEQRRNCDAFTGELIWREFYLQILHNFPHVMKGPFRPEYAALEWSDNDEHFDAWREGRTGYPIVDAAMRCLNANAWIHNRLRMIVAMFLTKDLLINWQWGERYFMHQLVDGDMAANNGGWQWSAGTGTDAAPYFRIFNPVTQAEKCDPDGEFVRTWVPELAELPAKLIHRPWEAPLMASQYSKRIVIHEQQRPKCLKMFEAVK